MKTTYFDAGSRMWCVIFFASCIISDIASSFHLEVVKDITISCFTSSKDGLASACSNTVSFAVRCKYTVSYAAVYKRTLQHPLRALVLLTAPNSPRLVA